MVCFHGSKTRGIKRLEPVVSTHGIAYVYAVKNKVFSALFLSGIGGDLTCSIGNFDGVPYIYERFEGAFDYRYSGVSGSIYTLSDESFMAGKTSWDEELVSEIAVEVIEEEFIEDVRDYILNFSKEELKIFRFHDRPEFIPEDDSDLIERAVLWSKNHPNIIKQFKKYHPHLIKKIMSSLVSDLDI